jgi:hypothetical protein
VRAIKLFLLAVLTFVGSNAAHAQWPSTTSTDEGRFWMEAGASAHDRPGGKLGLALISNDVTNDVLFTSDQLTDMNTAFGPNIRFGSKSRLGFNWEASTSMAKWETSDVFEGPNLTSPFIDPTLDPEEIGVGYDSEFFDVQFNFRRAIYPGMTFLIGPRYFQLNEELRLTTETTVSNLLVTSLNSADVSNSAIGGTIGFELNQPISRDIYIQGHVKASGLSNKGEMTRLADTNFGDPTTDSIDKSSGMFIGQTGGRVYFEVFPRRVATYLGYEANWLDGVATAPSQDFVVGGREMKNSNTIFWHSVNFGLKFTY